MRWGCGVVGSASRSQWEGHGFETPQLHHLISSGDSNQAGPRAWVRSSGFPGRVRVVGREGLAPVVERSVVARVARCSSELWGWVWFGHAGRQPTMTPRHRSTNQYYELTVLVTEGGLMAVRGLEDRKSTRLNSSH